MGNLIERPNIGKKLAAKLEDAGISDPEQLATIGSIEAIFRIRAQGRGCSSMLYALEGAIRGIRWHAIPTAERAALKRRFNEEASRRGDLGPNTNRPRPEAEQSDERDSKYRAFSGGAQPGGELSRVPRDRGVRADVARSQPPCELTRIVGAAPVEPWRTVFEKEEGRYRVFSVHRARRQSPRTLETHDFFVLHGDNWVNVIPVTPDGQVVFVRQYRHGTDEITLEIPGGIIEPGEPPDEAAAREMLEETGFEAERYLELGYVKPNPAIQVNRCYTFLAEDAHRVAEPNLDGTEEIDVVTAPLDALPRLVASGEIRHSLVIAAFYWFDLHLRGML